MREIPILSVRNVVPELTYSDLWNMRLIDEGPGNLKNTGNSGCWTPKLMKTVSGLDRKFAAIIGTGCLQPGKGVVK
jgi:hypothetical protein